MPKPRERLKLARQAAGLSEQEVAQRAGLTVNNYYDLEVYDDELPYVLSLSELCAVAAVVGLTPRQLFDECDLALQDPDKKMTFQQLHVLLTQAISSSKQALIDFEDKAGWEMAPFVASADAASDWNIDQLKDVCTALNVHWCRLLPDISRFAPPAK
jgi:transcriptional regulator with XRE-family HTH domain